MKKINFTFLITILLLKSLLLTSCEDAIEVDINDDNAQLVVDAWINNKPETQTIKLRRTLPYFDNSFAPEVTGATVIVADSDSTLFVFTDDNGDGNYTWTPSAGQTLNEEKDYALYIQLDGDEYISFSKMNRTMPIDSIHYEEREKLLGFPAGIYAQVYAVDPVGGGDVYWIKTFKNGQFLNKAQEMNLAYDAGFPGGSTDGVLLISPLRDLVNRFADTEEGAEDNLDVPPYAIGDTIRVEIHSLTLEAYYYLYEAQLQMTQGDNGIFSTPITNVPTNIFPRNENAKEDPVGFFCVSNVDVAERVIE